MPNNKSKTQLSREQGYTLLSIFARKIDANVDFSPLNDTIDNIMQVGLEHDAEFEEALHHVAYGKLDEVKQMLANNPHLLLQAGTVVTPGRLTVRRTTLLECALGAGDPEMAEIILPYFDNIEGGEEVKQSQLERFRPHIDGIMELNYDLTDLFEIINAASDEDVTQALNKNFDHESDLNQALQSFREAVRPSEIVNGMHYAYYATLLQTFEKLADEDEWKAFSRNYSNYDRCSLVWRQVVGYLQIGLPAIDRSNFAGAFNRSSRSFNFKYNETASYPDFSDADSGPPIFSGLGYDFAISLGDRWPRGCPSAPCAPHGRWRRLVHASAFQNLCRTKTSACRTYAATCPESGIMCNFMK